MSSMNGARRHRGLSLVEILIAMAAALVVIALVVNAITAFERDQAVRVKIADLQGSARQAVDLLGADLRHASLGTSSGVVWTASSGVRVRRPAVQIFSSLPGGDEGVITDAKASTDAILVVADVPGSAARTVTVNALQASTGDVTVADASGFQAGDAVLLGDYGEASWGRIAAPPVTSGANRFTLVDQTVNVLPGQPVPRLATGATVRRARSVLYYVSKADELVRLVLAVPYAPTSDADIITRDVLAGSFENMQVDCQLDDAAGGVAVCSEVATAAPVLVSDPVVTEATAAFGTFGTAGGPRFTAANIARLRGVLVNVAARSRTPLQDSAGDPLLPLLGAGGTAITLGPGSAAGVDGTKPFARRAYRLAVGLRNTSLGSF